MLWGADNDEPAYIGVGGPELHKLVASTVDGLPNQQWALWYTMAACDDDHDVWCDPSNNGEPRTRGGVAARGDGDDTFYTWRIRDAADGDIGALGYRINGAFTSLGNSGADESGKTFRLRVNGTTITGYTDDILAKTAVNSAITSGRRVGLHFTAWKTGGVAPQAQADDWGASNIPACPLREPDPGIEGIVPVWVQLLGDGQDENPYRPDKPKGVKHYHDDSIILKRTEDWAVPCHSACCVGVKSEDVVKVKTVVPNEADRLLWDMIRGCRRNAYLVPDGTHPPLEAHTEQHTWPSVAVRGGRVYYRPKPFTAPTPEAIAAADTAGTLNKTCGAIEDKADDFFDSIPNPTLTDDRKHMVVNLLERAGDYCLSAAKRLEIAERLDVADVEVEPKKI